MPNGQVVKAFRSITQMTEEERLSEILSLRKNGHLDRARATRLQVLEETFTLRPTKRITCFLLSEVIRLHQKKPATFIETDVKQPTANA